MLSTPYIGQGGRLGLRKEQHSDRGQCIGGILEGVQGGPLAGREVGEHFADCFTRAWNQSRIDPLGQAHDLPTRGDRVLVIGNAADENSDDVVEQECTVDEKFIGFRR